MNAGAIASEPFAQLGLALVARADHHIVAVAVEAGRQSPSDLARSQYADARRR
jgi:hypothetical protein